MVADGLGVCPILRNETWLFVNSPKTFFVLTGIGKHERGNVFARPLGSALRSPIPPARL
jgi:hypothetical protein